MSTNIRIGKIIQERREAAGYSVEGLAAAAGIDGNSIVRFENSDTGLTATDLTKLCSILKIDWFNLYRHALIKLPRANTYRSHFFSKLLSACKDWHLPDSGHWGETYLKEHDTILTADRTRHEISILREYLPPPPARILDAHCGHGRIAIQLATLGYPVTGVDMNGQFLAIARAQADGRDMPLELIKEDLVTYRSTSPFDAVLSIYTSIGYYIDEDSNWRLLDKLFDLVKLGGRLIIETINPYFIFRDYRADDLMSIDDQRKVYYERFYDEPSSRGFERITHIMASSPEIQLFYSVRIYYPHELTAFAESHGLSLLDMRTADGDREVVTAQDIRLWLIFERES